MARLSEIMSKEAYDRFLQAWDTTEESTNKQIKAIVYGWREIALRRLWNILEYDGSCLDVEWDWFDESCLRDGLMEACAQLENRVFSYLDEEI